MARALSDDREKLERELSGIRARGSRIAVKLRDLELMEQDVGAITPPGEELHRRIEEAKALIGAPVIEEEEDELMAGEVDF